MLLDFECNYIYLFYLEFSYLYYVLFIRDSWMVWFNVCYFYNGVIVQVELSEVEGNEFREDWLIMDEIVCVYVLVEVFEGMVFGDVYGYFKCIDKKGQEVWRYFVGSIIYLLVFLFD